MEDKKRSLILLKSNLSKEVLQQKVKIVAKALRNKKLNELNDTMNKGKK